jgi:hypothetical protein
MGLYSLIFRIKGEDKWLYADSKDTIMLIAALLENFHIPYELYERHTCIHRYPKE